MVDQRVLGLSPRQRSTFSDKLEEFARDNDYRGNELADRILWARFLKFAKRQPEVRGKTQPEHIAAIGEMMQAVLTVISLGIRVSEASEIFVKIDDEEVLQNLETELFSLPHSFQHIAEPKTLKKTQKIRKEGKGHSTILSKTKKIQKQMKNTSSYKVLSDLQRHVDRDTNISHTEDYSTSEDMEAPTVNKKDDYFLPASMNDDIIDLTTRKTSSKKNSYDRHKADNLYHHASRKIEKTATSERLRRYRSSSGDMIDLLTPPPTLASKSDSPNMVDLRANTNESTIKRPKPNLNEDKMCPDLDDIPFDESYTPQRSRKRLRRLYRGRTYEPRFVIRIPKLKGARSDYEYFPDEPSQSPSTSSSSVSGNKSDAIFGNGENYDGWRDEGKVLGTRDDYTSKSYADTERPRDWQSQDDGFATIQQTLRHMFAPRCSPFDAVIDLCSDGDAEQEDTSTYSPTKESPQYSKHNSGDDGTRHVASENKEFVFSDEQPLSSGDTTGQDSDSSSEHPEDNIIDIDDSDTESSSSEEIMSYKITNGTGLEQQLKPCETTPIESTSTAAFAKNPFNCRSIKEKIFIQLQRSIKES